MPHEQTKLEDFHDGKLSFEIKRTAHEPEDSQLDRIESMVKHLLASRQYSSGLPPSGRSPKTRPAREISRQDAQLLREVKQHPLFLKKKSALSD